MMSNLILPPEFKKQSRPKPRGPRLDITAYRFRAFGTLGKTYKKQIKQRQWKEDHRCRYCREEIKSYKEATIDHATPLCRGGDDRPSNLFLCCHDCQRFKGAKTLPEWRDEFLAMAARLNRLMAAGDC